jgi:hypothetical protein
MLHLIAFIGESIYFDSYRRCLHKLLIDQHAISSCTRKSGKRRKEMKKAFFGILLILLSISMLALAFNVQPVRAWGKSHYVAVIDDYYGSAVGYLYPSDYSDQMFSALSASQVSAETLANYDTAILFMFNPSLLTATQKATINDGSGATRFAVGLHLVTISIYYKYPGADRRVDR